MSAASNPTYFTLPAACARIVAMLSRRALGVGGLTDLMETAMSAAISADGVIDESIPGDAAHREATADAELARALHSALETRIEAVEAAAKRKG